MRPALLPALFIAALADTAATADITVTFRDGAPKDRFTITQTAGCATGPMVLTINLGPAPTGLIFDTTATGAGVEVFQPFEWVSAPGPATPVPSVSDGDSTLDLSLPDLVPGKPLAFTIDIDDTKGTRHITVSGSEVAGAQVSVSAGDRTETGTFDDSGTARIATSLCQS